MDLNIPPEVKGAGWGAMVTAALFAATRAYRIWSMARTLQHKYAHVTDETIRKELWGQWAQANDECKRLGKELADTRVQLQKVKDMHFNCIEETGTLHGQIATLKSRIDELTGKKPA